MRPEKGGRARERSARTMEIIAHEAARFIKEAAQGPESSLITVTRAMTLSHGERITVYVSVFPEEREGAALAFLSRQREAFSDHLKASTRLGPLPRVDFEVDHGEKVRRRLEELGGQ